MLSPVDRDVDILQDPVFGLGITKPNLTKLNRFNRVLEGFPLFARFIREAKKRFDRLNEVDLIKDV